MTSHHPRRARRGLRTKAVAVAAGALALTLGASVAASASDATGAAVKGAAAQHTTPAKSAFSTPDATLPPPNSGWAFPLNGRDSAGVIWEYAPKKGGGFEDRVNIGHGMDTASAMFQNNSGDSEQVNLYARIDGVLRLYAGSSESSGVSLGGGWNIYTTFVTPGDLGGAKYPDLLARDKSGVMWEYLSYDNGRFASRVRVGGGWNIYNQIAGRGDLNGDGKADLVARDASGGLWLYKGTGDYRKPFAGRVRVGGGWNIFNKLIGLGDNNGDGRNDLIARDGHGDLWLYQGTGSASAPFKSRVKIGWGWNSYNYLF